MPATDSPASSASPEVAARRVKDAALDAGFAAAGICDLRPIERDALRAWLDRGYAGNMGYMHRQYRKRMEPERIVRGARRAVVVLDNYYTDHPPPAPARISRYAWGEDYHDVVRRKLERVVSVLLELGATPECTRIYVDAGPVPERELAARAGLGWIARNTMLIHPRLGSFTFIGSVLTDLPLATDAPFESDHCGRCRLCLDACPTAAFPSPWVLDARRCISYLTIEYRGPFDEHQGRQIGDWLFGCDVCQDVCPWNRKFARPAQDPAYWPRPDLAELEPERVLAMDDGEVQRAIQGTALERAGAAGLRRNARALSRRLTGPEERTPRSYSSA